MLTISTNVFRCARELAAAIAEAAGLSMYVDQRNNSNDWEGEWFAGKKRFLEHSDHILWQDDQTGGGGCRIVWAAGVAWISRHSGYEWADVTGAVADMFRDYGACEEAQDHLAWDANPHIYGYEASKRKKDAIKWAPSLAHFFREGD